MALPNWTLRNFLNLQHSCHLSWLASRTVWLAVAWRQGRVGTLSTRLLTLPPLKSFVLPLWGPRIRLLAPRCQGAAFLFALLPRSPSVSFPQVGWQPTEDVWKWISLLPCLPLLPLLPQTVRTLWLLSTLGVCVRDFNLCLFSVNSSEVRAGEQTVRKPTQGGVSRYKSCLHGGEHTCSLVSPFPDSPSPRSCPGLSHSLWFSGFVS